MVLDPKITITHGLRSKHGRIGPHQAPTPGLILKKIKILKIRGQENAHISDSLVVFIFPFSLLKDKTQRKAKILKLVTEGPSQPPLPPLPPATAAPATAASCRPSNCSLLPHATSSESLLAGCTLSLKIRILIFLRFI